MCGLRRVVFTVAVLAMLSASARAQENLDRGKSPQQMFATDCAVCHKTPQGLSSKSGMLGLQEFLRKHYTASRESAQALADYLSRSGDAPAAKPAAKKKDPAKPAAAKPGEAKPADAKPAEAKAKPDEKKEEAPKAAQPAAASGAAPKNEPFPDVKPAQPAN